ncbi:Coiled-coil domain-containing protein [Histomonas meleagridis]|uniref:Coiled-coil domain-containing protein 63 n=1 Tax=Histomonas meleagridis TaxID=135588 RepID=UPI0035598754|nr:Coiled-coil domain-containing protein [Histomonas meleagridis]KAH0801171.1 Coiled-coil domain-containing protein 63 [Histomonas meleagridis]
MSSIRNQKKANETLRSELESYEKNQAKVEQYEKDYKSNETILSMNSQKKALENKLSILSADFAAEEQKRKRLEEEVSKARSKLGGLYSHAQELENRQTRLHIMENRLDQVLSMYNKNLIKLGEMRDQIDQYRKDRNTFRSIIKKEKLADELNAQRINQLIYESNEAYSQRDQLKMDLAQLRNAEKEDEQQYEIEISRYNSQIEAQKITNNHPRAAKQQVSSLYTSSCSVSEQQEETTSAIDQYQHTIKEILDLIQVKDADELIQKAEKLESENFSLYNYVVETEANRAKLQEELDSLKLRKKELEEQLTMSEEQQKNKIEELTDEINNLSLNLKNIKESNKDKKQSFKKICKKTEEIFQTLNCSWDNSPDENSKITNANIEFVLTSIERALSNLMKIVYEKAKVQISLGYDESLTYQNDEKSFNDTETLKSSLQRSQEINTEVLEQNRPLTIEEIKALL